jgi:hypothetical protein
MNRNHITTSGSSINERPNVLARSNPTLSQWRGDGVAGSGCSEGEEDSGNDDGDVRLVEAGVWGGNRWVKEDRHNEGMDGWMV